MAVTKTHPIKSTLKAAIDYILNLTIISVSMTMKYYVLRKKKS